MNWDIGVKGDYRPDVDGLRAVAVLSVIVFHIDKSLLPGGFVGVDIFFVISGFLISRNLLGDIEARRFSILDFYRRRVKRIAPALLVVVAATLAVSQLLMLPEDARNTAKSALWALLSLANVYFWLNKDTSYFAPDSSELPFLQLWSLGVEEQYYFIWPLLLFLCYRPKYRRGFVIALFLVALASFGSGELLFDRDPSFVYYMLPTRAGELMFGAMVAVATIKGTAWNLPAVVAGRGPVAVIAWLGLALIVATLFLLSDKDAFPGLRAIAPTAGTALIILCGHWYQGGLARLLSLRPMVWIGLVSYSAYLWHWPLLSFLRYGHARIGPLSGLVVFALTFVLAWLSYRYVEQPARSVRWSVLRVFELQYVVPAGALAALAVAAVKLDGFGLRYFDERYRSALAAMQNQVLPPHHFDFVCQRQRVPSDLLTSPQCVLGAPPEGPPQAILWGDSNAAHYVGIVAAFAQEAGFRFRNVAVGACPALDGDPRPFVDAERLADCRASLGVIRPAVERFPVVIVSMSWTAYRGGPEFLRAAEDTIRRLAGEGKQVVVLGKIPVIAEYDRRCREKALSYPFLDCPRSANPLPLGIAEVNAALKDFAGTVLNVTYFDVTRYLCPNDFCSAFGADGHPLYYDTGHLTMEASRELGQKIVARDGVPPPFRAIALSAAGAAAPTR